MRIMVICGFGLGSSMILKLKLDEVLKANDIKVDTFCADMTTGKGEKFDMLFTSQDLASHFTEIEQPVVVITNFLSKDEIEEKGIPAIREWLEAQA